MAKRKREELPRKGSEAVRFIEKNAEIIQKRQAGSHVVMRVKGPNGEAVVVVNVHGSQEMSTGVWHKVRKQLIGIGVLALIPLLLLAATFVLFTL
jgi:predicted RNA binding protein YcfA (HicA-like mRNA interferase family)